MHLARFGGLVGVAEQARIQEVLGGVGADEVELHALTGEFAFPGHVLHARSSEDDPAGGTGALDGDHVREAAPADVLIDGVGVVTAGVDGGGLDAQRAAKAVDDRRREVLGEGIPQRFVRRVAGEDVVVDRPGTIAPAVADDVDLQAVVLRVDAGGQRQAAGRDGAQRVGFGARREQRRLDVARAVGVGLAQARVHEAHELAVVALRLDPFDGELHPRAPQPQRAVDGVDVVRRVRRTRGFGDPAAFGEHGGLVVLVDLAAVVLAGVPGASDVARVVRVLVPAEIGPFEVLGFAAVRARDVVAAAIAGFE